MMQKNYMPCQIKAFKELLEKYQDFGTNPGNESVEKVEAPKYKVWLSHGIL